MLPKSILVRVILWSAVMTAYSGLAVWKESGEYHRWVDMPAGLEAALSVAFGLLLAFRVNRAFDRWWEGRTLWGMLVNACRNLAVKATVVLVARDESVERFQRLITVFPYALMQHLRDGVDHDELAEKLGERIDGEHVPSAIMVRIYAIIDTWKQQQRIQYGEFRMLDREAKVFLEICGGCERIRNTPIAPSYRVILDHAVVVYMLLLPWGIVNEFGWWTVPIVFITTYFVIGAKTIADHVEHPFVNDGDGLHLKSICAGIESSVEEIFAYSAPDPPLAPAKDNSFD